MSKQSSPASTKQKSNEKETAAQYIYNSMRSDTNKSIAARPLLRKMSSINDYDKNSNRSLGLLSIDMFPEQDCLDPTGGLMWSNYQQDSKRSINSSDFVKDAFLSGERINSGSSSSGRDTTNTMTMPQSRSPVLELTTKLERCTTGDDIIGENIRLSSSEWVKDFEMDGDAADVGPMPQSMFYDVGSASSHGGVPEADTRTALSPVPSQESCLSTVIRPLSLPPLSPSSSYRGTQTTRTNTTSSSSTKKTKTKKRRKRIVDTTTPCTPTDQDVLFGRGGYTNNNPGNIHFRAEALRLRPWYESSTKEEKYEISNLLLESVLSKGGRFLERKDGEWYEVIGGGARRKASQALRERIRGKVGGGLNSSLTTVKSVEEEDGDGNNIVHGEKVGV